MRFFARPQAELMDFKGFQQSVVTFLQPANRWGPWVTYGVFKICCYFSYKQRIDGTRWLLTVSSKPAVTFLTSSESMEPVGYLRCLQNLLLLFIQAANRWNPLVTFHSSSESMEPVGYIRCLQNLLLLFIQAANRWNPLVTFHLSSESMESVGYIRCLQNLLLLFIQAANRWNLWVTYGVFKNAINT